MNPQQKPSTETCEQVPDKNNGEVAAKKKARPNKRGRMRQKRYDDFRQMFDNFKGADAQSFRQLLNDQLDPPPTNSQFSSTRAADNWLQARMRRKRKQGH